MKRYITGFAIAATTAAVALAMSPSHAHMSDDCIAHVVEMEERAGETAEALSEIRRLTEAYAEDGTAAVASQDMERQMLYFVRLVRVQLPETLASFMRYTRKSTAYADSATAAIVCALDEAEPITTAAPVDLDQFNDWVESLEEGPAPETPPSPARVHLGLDCAPGVDANGDVVAYAVSLPDDVLTECE